MTTLGKSEDGRARFLGHQARERQSISSLKEKMHSQWWHNLVRPLRGGIVKDTQKLFDELEEEEAANDLAQDETSCNEPRDSDSDTE